MADERDIRIDVIGDGDGECGDLLEDCRVWASVRDDEYVVVHIL